MTPTYMQKLPSNDLNQNVDPYTAPTQLFKHAPTNESDDQVAVQRDPLMACRR